jgi:hypothetical protein
MEIPVLALLTLGLLAGLTYTAMESRLESGLFASFKKVPIW